MSPTFFRLPFFHLAVRHALLPALIAGGVLFALPAGAQVYKWTDANGRVTYSSTPPPGDQKSEPVQLRGVETYKAGPSQAPASRSSEPAQNDAAAANQAKPATKKAGATADPACNDGRTNCTRGESPEFDFPDRTNERVKPQFTVGAPPAKAK